MITSHLLAGLAWTALALVAGGLLLVVLDKLRGPRNWSVVSLGGTAWAMPEWRVIAADVVLRRGLREGQAQRVARRLRLRAEDMPDVLGLCQPGGVWFWPLGGGR